MHKASLCLASLRTLEGVERGQQGRTEARLELVATQEVAGPDLQGYDRALRGRGVAVDQQLQAGGGQAREGGGRRL